MKLIPQNIQWVVEQNIDVVMLSRPLIPTLYRLSSDHEFHPSKLRMLTGTLIYIITADKVPNIYF